MRNFKLFSILLSFFALVMLPSSCTKDDSESSKIEQQLIPNESFISPIGDCISKDRFAKTLSKSLKELDVTNFIIDNCLRLENGDPTFFLAYLTIKKQIQM